MNNIEQAINRIQICENYLKDAKESLAKAQAHKEQFTHGYHIGEIKEIMEQSSGVKVTWDTTQLSYAIEFISKGPVIQFYAWETIRQLMKKYELHGIKQNCDENVVVYVRKNE